MLFINENKTHKNYLERLGWINQSKMDLRTCLKGISGKNLLQVCVKKSLESMRTLIRPLDNMLSYHCWCFEKIRGKIRCDEVSHSATEFRIILFRVIRKVWRKLLPTSRCCSEQKIRIIGTEDVNFKHFYELGSSKVT